MLVEFDWKNKKNIFKRIRNVCTILDLKIRQNLEWTEFTTEKMFKSSISFLYKLLWE